MQKGRMVHRDIKSFRENLDLGKTIIGIDHGSRKIGIACSALNQTLALPYITYQRKTMKQDLKWFKELVKMKSPAAMVVGVPYPGNEWYQQVTRFAEKISRELAIDIYLEDETFSTKMALDKLYGFGREAIRKSKDMVAAAIILQQTLDKLSML